jgi:arylsulfatase A-like enzyme/Tfp pilus assembly protein PilF
MGREVHLLTLVADSRFVLVMMFTLVLSVSTDGPVAQNRPNIVLVTLDTTRADRMGFLGSTRNLTPNLDALARESIVFTRAYAQAPVTTVSHATILSGTFPPAHRVNDFGNPLPTSVPYLPDLLRQQGYRTGAFVGSLILDARGGTAPGFDRGFEVYDAGYRLRRPGEDRYSTVERRGDTVVARALEWATAQARQPFFLWLHLFDPHNPYDAPGDFKRRFASAPYDGEIAWVDQLVGGLLTAIKAKGLFEQSMIVVTADHGEALGDHGEQTHGLFLYDETLHVPLIVRLPGRQPPGTTGKRVDARVRLADVAPTILDASGIAVPPGVQGESLLKASADRPAYAETDYPRRGFGWAPLASLRADRFLFIRAPRLELYDQVADAAALRNLVSSRAGIADSMDRALRDFLVRSSAGPAADTKAPVDPQLAARLASLGYVSGSASRAASSGADPKDKVAVANALHAAVVSVEDGNFVNALPLLEKVTATEPDIWVAQLNLGVARARQRQYGRALAPLRKAIALQPDVMIARYELGVALYETGDLKSSAEELGIVASKMPKWADARYSLGSVYARIDRVPDAMRELQAAIALEPRHFRANLLLGRILALSGRADSAVAHLRTAVEVQPSSAEAHEFLADAYDKIGDREKAALERRRAEQVRAKKPAA